MGADGPGKAEIELDELLRTRIVCDDWEQASHNGEVANALREGKVRRDDVAELGRVLIGEEPGRRTNDEITAFDSTGLAVQDLAVALAILERYQAGPDTDVFASVVEIDLA
jgi:ornithine cyclodeaminase/alanine dehydrogenase-like protein (mu-crystallin family)